MAEHHLLSWMRPSALEVLRRRLEVVKSTLDATPVSVAQLRAVASYLDPWPQAVLPTKTAAAAAETDRSSAAIEQLRNEILAGNRQTSDQDNVESWDAGAEEMILASLREETTSALAQAKLRVKAVRMLEASAADRPHQPQANGAQNGAGSSASTATTTQTRYFPRRTLVPVLAEVLFDMALRTAARAAEGVSAPLCATSAMYHGDTFLDVQPSQHGDSLYSNQRVAAVTYRLLSEDNIDFLRSLPLPDLIRRCAAASRKEQSWMATAAASTMRATASDGRSPNKGSSSPLSTLSRTGKSHDTGVDEDTEEDEQPDDDAEVFRTRHFPFLRLTPPSKHLLLNTLLSTLTWNHAKVNPRNGHPPVMFTPTHELEDDLATSPMDAVVAASLIWWQASPMYEACHAAATDAFQSADIDDVDEVSWSGFTEYVTEYFLYGSDRTASSSGSSSSSAILGSTSFMYERREGVHPPDDTRTLASVPGCPHVLLASTKHDTFIVDANAMDVIATLDCASVLSCCSYAAPANLMTEVHRREAALTAAKYEEARLHKGLDAFSSLPSVVTIPDKYFEWLGPPPPRRHKSRRGVDSLPLLILLTGDLHLHIFRPTDEPVTVVSEYGSVEARRRGFGSDVHAGDRRVVLPMKRVRCDSTPRCLIASSDVSANDGRVFMGDGFGAVTVIDMRMLLMPDATITQCTMSRVVPHSKAVTSIIHIPHQQSLMTSSLDGYICLLDEASLVATRRFIGQSTGIRSMQYCPSANVIVTMGFGTTANAFIGLGRGRHFALFDGATPHLAQLAHIEIVPSLQQIITVDVSGLVKVWSLTEHKCLHTTDLGPKDLLASSEDEDASGGGSTTQPHIQTKHRVGLDFKSQLEALLEAGSPDLSVARVKSVVLCAGPGTAARIVICGHQHAAVADYVTTTQLARAHLAPVLAACCSVDGTLLVTCTTQEVRLWSLAHGMLRTAIPLRYLHEAGGTGDISAVALDGALMSKIFVGMSTGDVVEVRAASGKPIKVFSMGPEERKAAMASLPHGASLAVTLIGFDETTKGRAICVVHADNTVRLYNDVGESRRPFQYLQLDKRRSAQTCAAYSGPMRLVSSCNATGDVSIVGTDTVMRTMVHELSHTDETRAQCFLSPYPALAVGDVKGNIIIVHTRAGLQHDPVVTAHRPPTLCTIGHWSVPSMMSFDAFSLVLYVADSDGCVAAYHVGGLIHVMAEVGLRPTSLLRKFQPCARVRILAAGNCIENELLAPGCDEEVPATSGFEMALASSSMTKLVGVLHEKYHSTEGATNASATSAEATSTPYGAVTALAVAAFPQHAHHATSAWGTKNSTPLGAVVIGYANGTVILTTPDLTEVRAELVDRFAPVVPPDAIVHRSLTPETSSPVTASVPALPPNRGIKPLSVSILGTGVEQPVEAVGWEGEASPNVEASRSRRRAQRAYSVHPKASRAGSVVVAIALPALNKAQWASEHYLACCEDAFRALFASVTARHTAEADDASVPVARHNTVPLFSLTQPSMQNLKFQPFYAFWTASATQAAAAARADRYHKCSAVTKNRLWWERHKRLQRGSVFNASTTSHRSGAGSMRASPLRSHSQVPLTEDGGFDLDMLRAQLVMTPEEEEGEGETWQRAGSTAASGRRRSTLASGSGNMDPLDLVSPMKPLTHASLGVASQPRRPSTGSVMRQPGSVTARPTRHRSIGFAFDSSFLGRQDSFGVFLRGDQPPPQPQQQDGSDEASTAGGGGAAGRSSRLSVSSVGALSTASRIQSPGLGVNGVAMDGDSVGLLTPASSATLTVRPPVTLVANVASVKARQSLFGNRVAAALFGGKKDPSGVKQRPDFIKVEKTTVVSVVSDGELLGASPRERSVKFGEDSADVATTPIAIPNSSRGSRPSLKAVCEALQAGLRIAADRRKSGIDGDVGITGVKRPAPPKPVVSMPRGASSLVATQRLFHHPQLQSADPVVIPPLELPYRDVTTALPTSCLVEAPTTEHDQRASPSPVSDEEDRALLTDLSTQAAIPVDKSLRGATRMNSPPAHSEPKKVELTATHRRLVSQWRRTHGSDDDGGFSKPPPTAQDQRSARFERDMKLVPRRRPVGREI